MLQINKSNYKLGDKQFYKSTIRFVKIELNDIF